MAVYAARLPKVFAPALQLFAKYKRIQLQHSRCVLNPTDKPHRLWSTFCSVRATVAATTASKSCTELSWHAVATLLQQQAKAATTEHADTARTDEAAKTCWFPLCCSTRRASAALTRGVESRSTAFSLLLAKKSEAPARASYSLAVGKTLQFSGRGAFPPVARNSPLFQSLLVLRQLLLLLLHYCVAATTAAAAGEPVVAAVPVDADALSATAVAHAAAQPAAAAAAATLMLNLMAKQSKRK
eukprot:14414-Heterococcus_DN1.PRE.2